MSDTGPAKQTTIDVMNCGDGAPTSEFELLQRQRKTPVSNWQRKTGVHKESAMDIVPHTDGETRNAWQQNAFELASWVQAHMLNRSDQLTIWRNGWTSVTGGIPVRILQHFSEQTSPVVLYAMSETGTCLWTCHDFDNHDQLPDVAQRNMDVATGILNTLTELGIVSILEDSDGQGGLHLWVLFAEPVPVMLAYCFARWIVSDYPDDDIECNPKQRKGGTFGNGVRMPGRHHKRDHNSRLWGDAEWLDAAESIDLLLCTVPNSPDVLAAMNGYDPDPPPPPAPAPTRYSPNVTSSFGENDIDRAETHIESMSWPALLTSYGWKPETSDNYSWTRPGKESGVSATVNFSDNNMLSVFSDAEEHTRLPFKKGQPCTAYSKWRFWAHQEGFQDRQMEAAKTYLAGGAK